MTRITLHNVAKSYGDLKVIEGLNLVIENGEFMVFVGPSGCGKSTLLRMLAGLETISAGQVSFDDQRVNEIAPAERGAAMVFQSYALYPHMTVAENMGFALRMSGSSKAERASAVAHVAEKLQLTALLHRYPKELSGGQRQRVAIGRAIVRRPKVFLFDEPLSNLDAALRMQMRIELAKLHGELGTTMVYVTHDQTEAMTLGDRIAVFNQGRIEQVGRPTDLYRDPANRFVAEFLGSPKINLLPYRWDAASAQPLLGANNLRFAAPLPDAFQTHLMEGSQIGVRPEFIELHAAGPGLAAVIEFVENLGDSIVVYTRVSGIPEPVRIKVRPDVWRMQMGQAVSLVPDFSQCLVFRSDGQRIH